MLLAPSIPPLLGLPVPPCFHERKSEKVQRSSPVRRSAGRPPSSFPQRGLRLDYGDGLVQNAELAAVVGGLLEPLTEDRMRSREALGLLQGSLSAATCAPLHWDHMHYTPSPWNVWVLNQSLQTPEILQSAVGHSSLGLFLGSIWFCKLSKHG